jgi:hypothetical protein
VPHDAREIDVPVVLLEGRVATTVFVEELLEDAVRPAKLCQRRVGTKFVKGEGGSPLDAAGEQRSEVGQLHVDRCTAKSFPCSLWSPLGPTGNK